MTWRAWLLAGPAVDFSVSSRGSRGRRRDRSRNPVGIERLETRCLPSGINIQFDYTYDTNNFFDTQAKRDLLDQAAAVYESGQTGSVINPYGISDSLKAILPTGGNTWAANFTNPGTGANLNVDNLSIADGTYLVYVGGRSLPSGSTLAEAGPGGYTANGTQEWLDTVKARGQTGALSGTETDFGAWGGAMVFNTTVNWFYGSTTAGLAGTGKTDFITVATHELGHMLGFGTSDSFSNKISGSNFTGTNSVAAYDLGGNVPLSPDKGHWAQSVTDGGAVPSYTPAVSANSRKLTVDLDFAGIKDVGWTFSNGNQRMYRAYNPTADYHFFTISFPEFANAVANGYQDEATGQPSFAVPDSRRVGSVPIHRLYNPNNGRHYYTYDSNERDGLVTVGWRYEKDEGNIYTSQVSGTTEIFRLYNNNSGAHLYTADANQKDGILTQFPGIWVQHNSLGFACLVDSSGNVTQNAVAAPSTAAATSLPVVMMTEAGSSTDNSQASTAAAIAIDVAPTSTESLVVDSYSSQFVSDNSSTTTTTERGHDSEGNNDLSSLDDVFALSVNGGF